MDLKRTALTLLFCCSIISINAQDATDIDLGITYEMKGMHTLGVGYDKAKTINGNRPYVHNNPFMHFAIYGGLGVIPTYQDKYKVNLSLFFEERNHSGGSNVLKYWAIFPRITIDLVDTFHLFKQDLKTALIAGDLWNENFNDMLRIYNMDFHGYTARVGYKNFWLAVYGIGDLASNIGLGLHQMSKYGLEYNSDKIFNSLSFSINSIYQIPGPDRTISNYFSYKLSTNSSIEVQLDYRLNPNFTNGIAYGLGYQTQFKDHKVKARIRYYDKAYNAGHQFDQLIDYSNRAGGFTGDQLYPLKNYYRPINQWGLYTSYQGSNIYALEVCYDVRKTIYKKLKLISNFDINLLQVSKTDYFLVFPAYNTGLAYQFFDNFCFELTGTNKHMDLNNFYQGHTLSEQPFMAIAFKLTPPKTIPKLAIQ